VTVLDTSSFLCRGGRSSREKLALAFAAALAVLALILFLTCCCMCRRRRRKRSAMQTDPAYNFQNGHYDNTGIEMQ
jgi:hypothetical protein